MLLRSFIPTARRQPSRSRSASTWVERRVSARAGGDPVLLPAGVSPSLRVTFSPLRATVPHRPRSDRRAPSSPLLQVTTAFLRSVHLAVVEPRSRWQGAQADRRVRSPVPRVRRRGRGTSRWRGSRASCPHRRLAGGEQLLRFCDRPCDCLPNTFSHSALFVTHRMPIRSPLRSFARLPVRPYRRRRARVRMRKGEFKAAAATIAPSTRRTMIAPVPIWLGYPSAPIERVERTAALEPSAGVVGRSSCAARIKERQAGVR